jgi:hypothetical protein
VYIHTLRRAHFELLALNIDDSNHGLMDLIGLRIYAQIHQINTHALNYGLRLNQGNESCKGFKKGN